MGEFCCVGKLFRFERRSPIVFVALMAPARLAIRRLTAFPSVDEAFAPTRTRHVKGERLATAVERILLDMGDIRSRPMCLALLCDERSMAAAASNGA